MFWCKNCLMPNTRPRIEFNEDGVCNACQWHTLKQTSVDWPKRWAVLETICDKYRRSDGSFDCIIPVSGGKDSSYIAMQFKEKLGMHPLTVTFAHPMPTRLGWENWNNFIATGFDNIFITPNPGNYRQFARDSFIVRGMPKQPFVTGISTAICKLAKSMDIQLICFAEQGEIEYGGRSDTAKLQKMSQEFLVNIYYEGQSDMAKYGPWWEVPSEEDLRYLYVTWFSLYEDWDPEKHAIFAKQRCGMKVHDGPNIGTFTDYAQNEDLLQHLHTYLCFIKHGFGRCSADASIEIRYGRMTRERGVELARELDDIFPHEHVDAYCEYFNMTQSRFWSIVDKHVNKKILVIGRKYQKPWILKEQIK